MIPLDTCEIYMPRNPGLEVLQGRALRQSPVTLVTSLHRRRSEPCACRVTTHVESPGAGEECSSLELMTIAYAYALPPWKLHKCLESAVLRAEECELRGTCVIRNFSIRCHIWLSFRGAFFMRFPVSRVLTWRGAFYAVTSLPELWAMLCAHSAT